VVEVELADRSRHWPQLGQCADQEAIRGQYMLQDSSLTERGIDEQEFAALCHGPTLGRLLRARRRS
jgi:hypothetical protein